MENKEIKDYIIAKDENDINIIMKNSIGLEYLNYKVNGNTLIMYVKNSSKKVSSLIIEIENKKAKFLMIKAKRIKLKLTNISGDRVIKEIELKNKDL